MPWLKAGDNAATYPKLMMTASLGDERTVNEVAGWLHRCMEQSAGHMTDYLIDLGTAYMLGGSRTPELIAICGKVGLLTVEHRGDFEVLRVTADPAFLHARLKSEVEWERQRKRDNSNTRVTAPVRLRDGDGCRWCGVITQWGTADTKSARVGTYDHLTPETEKPATVDTLVVTCRNCNSTRGAILQAGQLWGRPLLDPPAHPFYSPETAEFLQKHLGIQVALSDDVQRPAPADPATGDLTSGETTPGDFAPSETPPPAAPVASPGQDQSSSTDTTGSADHRPPLSGSTGSGRVGGGSGQAGSGREGSGSSASPRSSKRRSRRGRGSR